MMRSAKNKKRYLSLSFDKVRLSLLAQALFVIPFFIIGCTAKEEISTTPSTSSELAKIESPSPIQASAFTVTGQILDWRAKPLSAATVTFETSQGTNSTTCDQSGSYSLQIVQAATDSIKITVKSALGEGGFVYPDFHSGQEPLQLDLMLGSDNSVELLD